MQLGVRKSLDLVGARTEDGFKMPARDPQAAHTYVARHSVRFIGRIGDQGPASGALKCEPRRRGAPPTGFRTSVRDVGGRVAEAQFLLC